MALRAEIHKMLVRIANGEDSDQTAYILRSSLIWVCAICRGLFAGNLRGVEKFVRIGTKKCDSKHIL